VHRKFSRKLVVVSQTMNHSVIWGRFHHPGLTLQLANPRLREPRVISSVRSIVIS